jgi:hypothetical protein
MDATGTPARSSQAVLKQPAAWSEEPAVRRDERRVEPAQHRTGLVDRRAGAVEESLHGVRDLGNLGLHQRHRGSD